MSNKILFQVWIEDVDTNYWVNIPSDASTTVPAGKERVIKKLVVVDMTKMTWWWDTSSTNVNIKYRVHIVKSWEVVQTKNTIAYYRQFQEKEKFHEYNDIHMSEWDYVIILARWWRLAISAYWEELPIEYAEDTLIALQRSASAVSWWLLHTDTVVNVTCNCV
jgi:hypothetical protein